MPLYTANAIVLRRISFGEIDRIVTLYTRERGKITAIAKGSRKAISRLSGPTEIATYARFQFATGKNLDVVAQAESKESFPRIHDDLNRIAYATYLAELVDVLVVEEHECNLNLFDLLLSSLYLLERPNDPEKIIRSFELKMMKILGYEPALDECLRCAKPLSTEDMYFSPSQGGIICRDCAPLPEDSMPISHQSKETMKTLLNSNAPQIERIEISRGVMDQITKAMRWYIRYRTDRDLRSIEFLQALRVGAAYEESGRGENSVQNCRPI